MIVGVLDYEVFKGGYGYVILCEYFMMEGVLIDLDFVCVGDWFVMFLWVKFFEKGGVCLMVNDLLFVGFEIDNLNFLCSGDL